MDPDVYALIVLIIALTILILNCAIILYKTLYWHHPYTRFTTLSLLMTFGLFIYGLGYYVFRLAQIANDETGMKLSLAIGSIGVNVALTSYMYNLYRRFIRLFLPDSKGAIFAKTLTSIAMVFFVLAMFLVLIVNSTLFYAIQLGGGVLVLILDFFYMTRYLSFSKSATKEFRFIARHGIIATCSSIIAGIAYGVRDGFAIRELTFVLIPFMELSVLVYIRLEIVLAELKLKADNLNTVNRKTKGDLESAKPQIGKTMLDRVLQ